MWKIYSIQKCLYTKLKSSISTYSFKCHQQWCRSALFHKKYAMCDWCYNVDCIRCTHLMNWDERRAIFQIILICVRCYFLKPIPYDVWGSRWFRAWNEVHVCQFGFAVVRNYQNHFSCNAFYKFQQRQPIYEMSCFHF